MALEDNNASQFPTFPLLNSGAQRLNRFQGAFPDPYLDYASTQMPRSIYDVLRWCEFVWITYGTYRMAARRVVRYFLTRIELTDASDDEKEKFETFLEEDLRIMEELATSGDNLMAYGNDFVSVYVPFRRYLRCPHCHIERPIGQIQYRWQQFKFLGTCSNPKCKHEVEFVRVDRRSLDQDKPKIVHWPAHEMRILYNQVSKKSVYLWEIPPLYKDMIKRGNTFYLESTPWEIIEAIKDDVLFRFHDEQIFHLKDEIISGVRHYGWGIPLIMGNFKQAWYIQVLKRYNEAIALDYIIPFRVITPAPGSSREADPLLHMNLNTFYSRVMGMFRQHRRDPTSIHALPFGVNLQMLGADAKNLAPTDLIDKATDEFLNAQGVPAELYRGSLQWQAMPVALRLFERTWVSLVNGLNSQINWLFRRLSDLQNWENLKGRLQPVTLADDLEKKQIQLQLAAGKQISQQTALAPFGINFRDEIKRMLEEEEYSQEEMAKFQEDMAQKQELQQVMAQGAMGMGMPGAAGAMPGAPGVPPGQMGGPAPADPAQGGDPAQAGAAPMPMSPSQQVMAASSSGPAGTTPEDLAQQAEQLAYQLLSMPYEMRKSELLKIKKSNETLHAIVISKMEKIRQDAQTQGGYQVLQQQVGAGAAM